LILFGPSIVYKVYCPLKEKVYCGHTISHLFMSCTISSIRCVAFWIYPYFVFWNMNSYFVFWIPHFIVSKSMVTHTWISEVRYCRSLHREMISEHLFGDNFCDNFFSYTYIIFYFISLLLWFRVNATFSL